MVGSQALAFFGIDRLSRVQLAPIVPAIAVRVRRQAWGFGDLNRRVGLRAERFVLLFSITTYSGTRKDETRLFARCPRR